MEQDTTQGNTLTIQGKDTASHTQLQTIFDYLQTHVVTASMLSAATGVPQKNICRYKRDLQKEGRLAEVRKGYCKLTGFQAWYITTDPTKFPPPVQLTIFGNNSDERKVSNE